MTLLNRWPAALGLAAAAGQLALGPDTDTIATVLAVAVLCYLGAAAFDRRWVSWAGCLVFPAIIVAARFADLTWWLVGALVALALVVVGLILRAPRRALTVETAGLLGYGAVAVLALSLSPRAGLAVAGVALCAHAVWDVIHYRRDVVVKRSLAEFCVLLDVPLGIAAIILAITG
ncbi:hypothetical protein ACQPZX_30960 [Actinoplanes sp. CA-142083]|uniref:hypothetical protein n=1 Tax=Actinoplanes sp. CA-142083 TaxID=3239903 RepID=UPI003D8E9ACE